MQTYEEVWKDIPNYEGLYQVSNLGRVRSIKKIAARGHRSKGKILKPNIVNGYCYVGLFKNGSQKNILAHRLVALAFIGESDLYINHKNAVKTDNRVENLEYVTPQQNTSHAVEMGLIKSKLTEAEAREIKYGYRGLTQKEIASKYGIVRSRVSAIRLGKAWKHI